MVAHARATRLLQLVQDNAGPLTYKVLRRWVKTAQRMAGLKVTGKFHVLRHTFCSHLAMKGAPAVAITCWPGTASPYASSQPGGMSPLGLE